MCSNRIGRVEFVVKGDLMRLYFPIPRYFRTNHDKKGSKKQEKEMQKSLEERFIEKKIDWTKSTDKIEEFVAWSEEQLMIVDKTRERSSTQWQNKLLDLDLWDYSSIICATLINMLIFGWMGRGSDDVLATWSTLPNQVRITMYVLAALQIVLCLGQLCTYTWTAYPRFLRKALAPFTPKKKSYLLLTNQQRFWKLREATNGSLIRLSVVLSRSFLTDPMFLLYIFGFVLSGLGIWVPYWYAYHFLQVVVKSKHLRTVAIAIRSSFTTLVQIFLLILGLLYAFSIVSYVGLSEHFFASGYGGTCDSIMACFASNLYAGIPSAGGLNQLVGGYQWNMTGDTILFISYVVMYYVVFGLLMLNIFLAIIVDTFSALRDIRAQARLAKGNSCFVCSIEREQFKRKGIEFNNHVMNEHNTWHYFYFLVHLKDQLNLNLELSAMEQIVRQKIEDSRFLEVFPIERALSTESQSANTFDHQHHSSQESRITEVPLHQMQDAPQVAKDQEERLIGIQMQRVLQTTRSVRRDSVSGPSPFV